MPQMADITVKKADETTNIVYTQFVPSAGDKSAALWKSTSVGSAPGFNPSLAMDSSDNGPKTARRVNLRFAYPYTVTGGDGTVSVSDTFRFDGTAVVPNRMPQSVIDEAAAQAMNLFASTLVKACLKSGYSPT